MKMGLKRYTLFTVFTAVSLMLAACGNDAPAGGNSGQSAAPPVSSASPAAGSTGSGASSPADAAPGASSPAPSTPPSSNGAQAPSAASASKAAVDAEAIVKQSCISCHGDTLDGKGNAKKNLQQIGARLTKEQIVNQITNGGERMPGFKEKLKESEIMAVASWLADKK